MTVNVNLPAPTGGMSQATSIEQSRAVAEVLAAVEVAQRCPRDIEAAFREMLRVCSNRPLAEKAFYSMPRAGGTVSGESIHLARELARCWTNLDHGIKELARDDDRGQSEMLAYAWDLQRNYRVTSSFIVPHKRDTRQGVKKIVELAQIYENNANAGARRVRECIFAVLPADFREDARQLCQDTLSRMSPKEMQERAAAVVAQFGRGSITLAQLEGKVGYGRDQWTPEDIVDLEVLFQSLKRREISRDEAFPPAPVTAAEIAGQAAEPGNGDWPATADVPPSPADDERSGGEAQ